MQLAKQKPNDLVEEWPAATHLQVFIFRGAAWHFKLLGDYNFTGMLLTLSNTFFGVMLKEL